MKKGIKFFKAVAGVAMSVLCIGASMPVAMATNVDSIMSKMTLEEKIGQMITVSVENWNGEGFTIMEDGVAEIISKNSVGGVILFEENLETTEQIVALTSAFQNAALSSKNKVPLFISTDQEGGEVVRLKYGTSLPGNMAIGATNNAQYAKTAGNILGSELSALGINVDFAPSLDVNTNPQNPIIGLRSYSSDANLVARLGVQTINGIQEKNVVAAAKHFPGHGDTYTDSHTGLPAVDKSLQEIEACELVPFKAAIENGVDMIMTAHIQFPQIEKQTAVSEITGKEVALPATLSKTIINDILRAKLGYNGVVTTDAMNMGAIADNFSTAQASILAINAGVDMLLMPVSIADDSSARELSDLIGMIKSAVKDGRIEEARVNESVKRILQLKEKRGILDYKAPTVENALKTVGSVENHEAEDDIATGAITVLKNENNLLPFKPQQGQKVVLISAYSDEITCFDFAMSRMIAKNTIPAVEYETYYYNNGTSLEEILTAVGSADYAIVLSEMLSNSDISPDSLCTTVTKSVSDYAKQNGIKCAVVSVGKPYDTANYTNADALLVAYGCKGMNAEDTNGALPATYTYGPNIIAAVEVAFGYKNPYGTLPVDVPRIREDGSMDISQNVFNKGDGLLYQGTVRPSEITEAVTEMSTTVITDHNNEGAVTKLFMNMHDKGVLNIFILLSVCAAIVFCILVVLIIRNRSVSKRKKNRKARVKKSTQAILEEFEQEVVQKETLDEAEKTEETE
ncbi:MAG: glycoside hydrolase family 3 N-terminal domain-containing protein [Acutalibacteraceae bacterium]|nr:glycoside hydrolase family 3 N-terminal domain-containing protein [Acutalibacteraceae bacterium]